jgi:hypothetical protein
MIKAILPFRVAIPAQLNRPTVNPPFTFFPFSLQYGELSAETNCPIAIGMDREGGREGGA